MSKEYVMQLESTIANLERDKQILKDELFKYRKLEKDLGCPLDVLEQLFKQDFIYFKYLGNVQIMKVKVIKGLSSGENLGWHFTCIYANLDFIYVSLKDYKKTWWLREDRSE